MIGVARACPCVGYRRTRRSWPHHAVLKCDRLRHHWIFERDQDGDTAHASYRLVLFNHPSTTENERVPRKRRKRPGDGTHDCAIGQVRDSRIYGVTRIVLPARRFLTPPSSS